MTGILTSWNPIGGVHRHAAPFKRAKDRDKKEFAEREKIGSQIRSLVTSEDRFAMVNFVDLFCIFLVLTMLRKGLLTDRLCAVLDDVTEPMTFEFDCRITG